MGRQPTAQQVAPLGGGSYPSTEMQSAYSTAPADRADLIIVYIKRNYNVNDQLANNNFVWSSFEPSVIFFILQIIDIMELTMKC